MCLQVGVEVKREKEKQIERMSGKSVSLKTSEDDDDWLMTSTAECREYTHCLCQTPTVFLRITTWFSSRFQLHVMIIPVIVV